MGPGSTVVSLKGLQVGLGGELGVPRRSHWLWGALIGFVVNP